MNLTAKLLAAAWRENLADTRTRRLEAPYTATEGPFNQLTITEPPHQTPLALLETILGAPPPTHLAAEIASADLGGRIAEARAAGRARHLAALAARAGTPTLAALIARCTKGPDTTARLLETLATDGHQLHPCARTRLGWSSHDCTRYDLEAARPIGVRLLADPTRMLSGSGTDLRDHPMLAGLDLPDPVVPVHPWQLKHRILPAYRDLFADHRLILLDHTVPAWPTAAIRTVTGAQRPGYLKLALGIHITSSRRDIAPATAALAPALTAALADLIETDPGHAVAADEAGVWLPGTRDLTAIARSGLAEAAPPGAVVVPAVALTARSPVTGLSLAAEYATWSGDPEAWIRDYAGLVAPPVLRLAAHHGIGLEAHLQNSLIAFDGPAPVRLITRDLGGVRLWRPALPFDVEVPESSPVAAASWDQVRAKVAYTLFQNQLAAVADVLARDCGLDAGRFWADLADLVAGLDLPRADREAYLGPRMPTKALLTMRLSPGAEVETYVDNPLAGRGR
ncbi:IucA/IucC family protein [Glycomyces xiaoerkulensis]|uniref:IucA/IucC family protein n=1 Tax=Glycomyces xiaoerkulensis TaxID=2038139 RepID=UPI0018E4940D|nr:IucA/IucC family protein [Glycomyces xiaoerkulensis]